MLPLFWVERCCEQDKSIQNWAPLWQGCPPKYVNHSEVETKFPTRNYIRVYVNIYIWYMLCLFVEIYCPSSPGNPVCYEQHLWRLRDWRRMCLKKKNLRKNFKAPRGDPTFRFFRRCFFLGVWFFYFFSRWDSCTVAHLIFCWFVRFEDLPSLKLTCSQLKIDSWKVIVSFWGPAFRQVTFSFRELYPLHPCMVYLPTLSYIRLFLMERYGKCRQIYTIDGILWAKVSTHICQILQNGDHLTRCFRGLQGCNLHIVEASSHWKPGHLPGWFIIRWDISTVPSCHPCYHGNPSYPPPKLPPPRNKALLSAY